jgi:hypothetical protein
MAMVDFRAPRGPTEPLPADRSAPGVPERRSLATRDFDEALAGTTGLFGYPMQWRLVGPSADLDFQLDGVQLGPVTIGEGSFGTDVFIDVDDLESSYNVLMPLNGVVGARQRDSAVAATTRTSALLGPKGRFQLTWPGETRLLSVKIDRAALEHEVAGYTSALIDAPPTIDLTAGSARSWLSRGAAAAAGTQGPGQPGLAARHGHAMVSARG